jgi:hypothetical protein
VKELTNNSEKVVIICVGIKPKYNDFFYYIINNLKDTICMITNSDIYFLECDIKLIDRIKNEKYAMLYLDMNMI